MSEQLRLFGEEAVEAATPPARRELPDQHARDYAVDPRHNVVLEASAGTGKTTVLVLRYLNLLRAGVDPSNILAMTFTRKAAAEMRDRIIRELKRSAAVSRADRARWEALRDRLSDIDISTIDAFCLALLREFPLEADLEPGFSMADETEVPRLIEEALDRALRVCLLQARADEDLALVLAQLGITRARTGLTHLLQRRIVARRALDRFLASAPGSLRIGDVCRDSVRRLQDALRGVPGGLETFVADGPRGHPRFRVLARDLLRLDQLRAATPAVVRGLMDRVRHHFLTLQGGPRNAGALPPYKAEHSDTVDAWRRHRQAIAAAAPAVKDALDAFSRDLNVILARGVRTMFAIALAEYRKTLEERSVLDFSDVLERAIALLRQMDEFAQSRFRLEARYHHVLVDEFQDTSRAQWQLVSLLIEAWGEGRGVADDAPLPPSIFVVGDRKQSIYRFRDAEVTVLQEAGEYIRRLRPGGASPRRAISHSFRARPELLSFVNDLFDVVPKEARPDAFRFETTDRFPIPEEPRADAEEKPAGPASATPRPLGLVAAETPEACAAAVAEEIGRLIGGADVRDRDSGIPRPARPGDIAILFRSRASHREFEDALDARGIPAYVYKGLGFFDADETKDLVALLRFLADPSSEVRAAAFLRSRFVRVSDEGLCHLAPHLAAALRQDRPVPPGVPADDGLRLARARVSLAGWLRLADQIPPAELIDRILADSAYDYELRGPRRAQARENVKKMRALIRRIQNRGYATLRRIAEHLDSLSTGDESNATLEAVNAVNLMTVHAAKGLEFPVVFVVNLAKGAGGPPQPIRVSAETAEGDASVSVASYISEVDEDARAREAEETKRLLYVALTRARDALYLGTVLKDGVLKPGRGSLAEVLPASVCPLFSSAVAAQERAEWEGPAGRRHTLRVVPPAEPLAPGRTPGRAEEAPARQAFGPLHFARDFPRVSATNFAGEAPGGLATAGAELEPSEPYVGADELAVGTLVHRLFQHAAPPGDRNRLARQASALLRPEERAQLEDPRRTADAAAALYGALAQRPDVAQLLSSGVCEYEVPFSFVVEPAVAGPGAASGEPAGAVVLRGTMDCLVRQPTGSVLVLDFKTGRPRAQHRRQLEIYVAAAKAMFPGADVTGRVLYADPASRA
ncbi:MAG TPA: UvrD-helicase domain-containing protein [Vicinamibacterales bacterium]|nr:UvrD-helicase domain-containing protein [Vicinamibacterales bacterium]